MAGGRMDDIKLSHADQYDFRFDLFFSFSFKNIF